MSLREITQELSSWFVKHKWVFAASLPLVAAGLILSLATPILSQRIIDDGLLRKDIHTVSVFGAVFLLVALLSYVVTSVRQYLFAVMQQKVILDVRTALARHILRLPMHYLNGSPVGYLVSHVDNDVSNLVGAMGDRFVQASVDLLILVGAVLIVFRLNWRLALVTMTVMPVFLWSVNFFSRKTYGLSHELREVYARLAARVQELVSTIYLIKISRTEESEIGSFVKTQNRVRWVSA